MPIVDAKTWDKFLERCPSAHLLQTAAWGELKSGFGWSAMRLVQGDSGVQLLFRRVLPGLSLAYIARGPVAAQGNVGLDGALEALLPEIDGVCQKAGCVFLKIEPDGWQGQNGAPTQPPPGFCIGEQSVQPPRTIVVDLAGSEDEILSRMKQKTRYNIRLAVKKGVRVNPSADLDLFYRLMSATGERDTFGVHSRAYYQRAYELFYPHGGCELLVAEHEGEPLAAVMVFARADRAWYFYGASANEKRELMATYLVQWEAMRWARRLGCREYDLWGVPDHDEQVLEDDLASRTQTANMQRDLGLWGVYRFKRGFGGRLLRSPGPWDRVYRQLPYAFYSWWIRRRQRVA